MSRFYCISLLLILPFCVAWNGSGRGSIDHSSGHGTSMTLSVEAVTSVKNRRMEAVIILPLEAGDGVLTIHAPVGGELSLPTPAVTVRYREYGSDGETLFHNTEVRGALEVRSQGPELWVVLNLTLVRDGSSRFLKGQFSLIPTQWSQRNDAPIGQTNPDGSYYEETGCGGTWHDYSEDYEEDEESWNDGESGCAGDDLDDESSSESSGCAGDDVGDSDYDDSSGCEGDSIDSSDDSDDDDSSGCEGDDVDAMVVGCAGGSGPRPMGRHPWVRRGVRWLPWFWAALMLRLMRRRRRVAC